MGPLSLFAFSGLQWGSEPFAPLFLLLGLSLVHQGLEVPLVGALVPGMLVLLLQLRGAAGPRPAVAAPACHLLSSV